LATDMMHSDPAQHPGMDDVFTRLQVLRQGLSKWKLRSRVAHDFFFIPWPTGPVAFSTQYTTFPQRIPRRASDRAGLFVQSLTVICVFTIIFVYLVCHSNLILKSDTIPVTFLFYHVSYVPIGSVNPCVCCSVHQPLFTARDGQARTVCLDEKSCHESC
jgi:hypothetical protein